MPPSRPATARLLLPAFVLAFFASPLPDLAHNGAVVIAVPVEGITLDGDLSDWPEDMTANAYPVDSASYNMRNTYSMRMR